MGKILMKTAACLFFLLRADFCLTFTLYADRVNNHIFPLGASRGVQDGSDHDNNTNKHPKNRRHFFSAVAQAALIAAGVPQVSLAVSSPYPPQQDIAAVVLSSPSLAAAEATITMPMKEFLDPYGMFSIKVPEGFYTLRRKTKGDLPDEKGQGKRGSSIFTAGNMAKAIVVAVERFPVRVLLEENGIEATGSLSTFPDIGEPAVVASLINLRREKDRPGASNTVLDPTSVMVSSDGKDLFFKLRTEIDVQKPELLMEQYGVDRLFRITLAKASLSSNDGNLLAVFASALETDFNSLDGLALKQTVESFRAIDREYGF